LKSIRRNDQLPFIEETEDPIYVPTKFNANLV